MLLAEFGEFPVQLPVAELLPQRPQGLLDRGLSLLEYLFRAQAALRPQPAARRTGTVGTVEGEQGRRDRAKGGPAGRTTRPHRERHIAPPLHRRQTDLSLADLQRGLQRALQAPSGIRLDHQTIHHHLETPPLQVRWIRLLHEQRLTVLSDATISDPVDPVQKGGPVFLRGHSPGRQHQQSGSLGQTGGGFVDLFEALPLNRGAAVQAMRLAQAGEEQAQIVIDPGQGGHGRAGILPGAALPDGDGRRQALQMLDPGRPESAHQGLARPVYGHQVAPPGLGVDGVEGQRGFPRTRNTADRDQVTVRQVHVQVLQVVLGRAAD